MCGRYFVEDEMYREIQKITRSIDKRLNMEISKEIYPSAIAPIIYPKEDKLVMDNHIWGFPHFNKKSGVIFNARSETVLEKRMFSKSVKTKRCVIPATCYYEWNVNKDKYAFQNTEDKPLLFAGFHNTFNDEDRFVIITTEANSSVKDIHSRMPLILENNEIDSWLHDDNSIEFILHKVPKGLKKEMQRK